MKTKSPIFFDKAMLLAEIADNAGPGHIIQAPPTSATVSISVVSKTIILSAKLTICCFSSNQISE